MVTLVKLSDMEMAQDMYVAATAMSTRSFVPEFPRELAAAALAAPDSFWREVRLHGGDAWPGSVGLVGLERVNLIDRVAEPLIALLPEAQHQGNGLSAARAMLSLATDTLNIRRLQTIVLECSPAKPILEALGFAVEGHLRAVRYLNGRYVDALCYAHIASER